MDQIELTLTRQRLEITPDGLVRNTERRREFTDADGIRRPQASDNVILAACGERTRHANPEKWMRNVAKLRAQDKNLNILCRLIVSNGEKC
jgi:hypothetical protein